MTTSPLSFAKIQNVAWAIFFAWVFLFIFMLHYTMGFGLLLSVCDSLITNSLLATGGVIVTNLLGYYRAKKETVFFVLVLTIVMSVIIVSTSQYILDFLFAKDLAYKEFLNLSLIFRGVLFFVFLAWCALANILWYKLEDQSDMQKRLLMTQDLSKEAELNKLRHQLQPHFLFNSLNSVYALTLVDPKEAGVMITKLASFLRGTLKRDDKFLVSVSEEMEHIELYLSIEKVRFSHRLNVSIDVDENTLDLRLPGTLLQPIVENAIKFGLYNTTDGVLISIKVRLDHEHLIIEVKNPFDPAMKRAEGTGFGLTAIRRRLYLLFADERLLQTRSTPDNFFITSLTIPQNNHESYTN